MPGISPELIRTTARSAEKLAVLHGAKNFNAFVRGLPAGGRFLDVGAGDCPLGLRVAWERPDIEWTNFDYSYYDEAVVEQLREVAPDNLQYVAGDATKLDSHYAPGTFDGAFSYWLAGHLPPEQRLGTMAAMHEITKPDGFLSIGPWTGTQGKTKGLIGSIWSLRAPALQVQKDPEATPEEANTLVAQLAAETAIPARIVGAFEAHHQAAAELFGTNRYFVRDHSTNARLVYNPETGLYVPTLRTVQGLRIVGDLAVRSVQQYRRNKLIELE